MTMEWREVREGIWVHKTDRASVIRGAGLFIGNNHMVYIRMEGPAYPDGTVPMLAERCFGHENGVVARILGGFLQDDGRILDKRGEEVV